MRFPGLTWARRPHVKVEVEFQQMSSAQFPGAGEFETQFAQKHNCLVVIDRGVEYQFQGVVLTRVVRRCSDQSASDFRRGWATMNISNILNTF